MSPSSLSLSSPCQLDGSWGRGGTLPSTTQHTGATGLIELKP